MTSLYPAKRNEAFTLDREITPEKITSNYNNFYEFSTNKHLSTDPEAAAVDGMPSVLESTLEQSRRNRPWRLISPRLWRS
jgi:hypothetical protein